MKRIIRLTESDLIKIVKMVINEDDPKTPTTAKTPSAKVEVSFKMSAGAGSIQNLKNVMECKVYGTLIKDPKTGKLSPPNQLYLVLSKNGQYVPSINFRLNTTNNTYSMEPGQNNLRVGSGLVEFLRYKTDHIVDLNPATALTQITSTIKNRTGVEVNIDPTVVSNIREAYNIYWKTGIIDVKQTPITGGVLKPFKRVLLDKYINPETNQEYIDARKLVLGNGAYGFIIKNDKIAGFTNVGTRSDFVSFLRQSSPDVPETMDTPTILAKAKSEAQAYYDQLK